MKALECPAKTIWGVIAVFCGNVNDLGIGAA